MLILKWIYAYLEMLFLRWRIAYLEMLIQKCFSRISYPDLLITRCLCLSRISLNIQHNFHNEVVIFSKFFKTRVQRVNPRNPQNPWNIRILEVLMDYLLFELWDKHFTNNVNELLSSFIQWVNFETNWIIWWICELTIFSDWCTFQNVFWNYKAISIDWQT